MKERLKIEKVGAGGDGVARLRGRTIYVAFAAPGDAVEVELAGARGTLVALIAPGPDRAAPPCGHFGTCGGCALQHLTEAFQRAWKRERIIGALARMGIDAPVAPMIAVPAASRRRATFAVRRAATGVALGFNARRSPILVDIQECAVLHPKIVERLPRLRQLAAHIRSANFDLAATLCDNGLDVDIAAKEAAEPRGAELAALIDDARRAGVARLSFNGEAIATLASPIVRFDGVAATPPPGAFLQASAEGEAALIALVKKACGGAPKIADLFSGCGTFSLPLSKTATVHAVDADARALAALASAAAAAQSGGAHPATTETRDLFERPLAAKELKPYGAVIFDPPRAGALAQAREIAASKVPIVVGVSCNPGSFARDAAIFLGGGYALSQVTGVDQFLYSTHVELVGVFLKD